MTIHRTILLYVAFCGLLTLGAACRQDRARAVVEDQSVADGPKKDYREMLTKVREKQSDQTMVSTLEVAINKFRGDLGRLPTNLYELVAMRYVPSLPNLPDGKGFYYDPIRGNVAVGDLNMPVPENISDQAIFEKTLKLK